MNVTEQDFNKAAKLINLLQRNIAYYEEVLVQKKALLARVENDVALAALLEREIRA